jgi:hypothetical protein
LPATALTAPTVLSELATGYRRYLKTISGEQFPIDPDKIEEDKKLDGIFVLRTNTNFNPLEAMLCYKHLRTVEQIFRMAKPLFSTRPIFHKWSTTPAVTCSAASSRWC